MHWKWGKFRSHVSGCENLTCTASSLVVVPTDVNQDNTSLQLEAPGRGLLFLPLLPPFSVLTKFQNFVKDYCEGAPHPRGHLGERFQFQVGLNTDMSSKSYKLVTNEIWLQTGRLLQIWGIKSWNICLNSVTEARVLAGLRWYLTRLWKGVYDRLNEHIGRATYDNSQYVGLVKGRMWLLLRSGATSWSTPALLWRCAGHLPGSQFLLFPSTTQ